VSKTKPRLVKPDYLGELEVAARGRAAYDALVLECVQVARDGGCTWEEIGTALGVTHQAARQRYAKHMRDG